MTQVTLGCTPPPPMVSGPVGIPRRLKGRQPKLTPGQQAELARVHATGDYTIAELMEVFSIGRATVYRTLERTHSREVASAGRRNPARTAGRSASRRAAP
jgi:hypothetical protein